MPDPLLRQDPIAEATRLWAAHGWPDAAPGMAALTSLMRAHQIALSRVESVLKPLKVTFARYEVLMLLEFSRRASLPMSTIGSRLQVHATSVTNAVDRLESAGLVRRLPPPTDGRATLVEITPAGRALAAEATTLLNESVFSNPGLSATDTQSLVDILARYRQDAGDF